MSSPDRPIITRPLIGQKMSSSSISRVVCEDDRVQAVMFAVGLVVGSGITVCIMRRNVQRLEEYVELLRREVRRLRTAVDDHLALFDGVHNVYNNNSQISSYPTTSPNPSQTPNGSTLTRSAPASPRRRQSPLRQASRSTSHPPSPRLSPASNSDGEGFLSARGR